MMALNQYMIDKDVNPKFSTIIQGKGKKSICLYTAYMSQVCPTRNSSPT